MNLSELELKSILSRPAMNNDYRLDRISALKLMLVAAPTVVGDWQTMLEYEQRVCAEHSCKIHKSAIFGRSLLSLSGCWEWSGRKNQYGYGIVLFNGHRVVAHRAVWAVCCGGWPDRALQVMHRCDNPCCINPHHLRLGTNRDNVDDKVQKQRHTFGGTHPSSKLSQAEVLWLRSTIDTISGKAASRILGVAESTVCRARTRYNWKCI